MSFKNSGFSLIKILRHQIAPDEMNFLFSSKRRVGCISLQVFSSLDEYLKNIFSNIELLQTADVKISLLLPNLLLNYKIDKKACVRSALNFNEINSKDNKFLGNFWRIIPLKIKISDKQKVEGLSPSRWNQYLIKFGMFYDLR